MVLAAAIRRLREKHAARRPKHAERRVVKGTRDRIGGDERRWRRALQLDDEHRPRARRDRLEAGVQLGGRANQMAAAAGLLAELAQVRGRVRACVRWQCELRFGRLRVGHLTRGKTQHDAEYTLVPAERLVVQLGAERESRQDELNEFCILYISQLKTKAIN